MKPSDYKEHVYKIGIPLRVREMESEVQAYQRDYPELFLSETPIQLLRPEQRNGASSNGTGHTDKTPHPPGGYSRAVIRKRENSAALLAWINAGHDRSRTLQAMRDRGTDMRGIHQLVNNGYLIRRGNKLARTKKEYNVTKWTKRNTAAEPAPEKKKSTREQGYYSKPQKKFYGAASLKRREASAALIASFDTETPSAPPAKFKLAMGALTRRGYLRKMGKGLYVRTEKVYEVRPT